jgi:predicted metal-binding protein
VNVDDLYDKIEEFNKDITIHPVQASQIIFEQRVKLNCFYCSKYDTKWTCPPRIPKLNYQEIINEYGNKAIVIIKLNINNNFDEIRNKSTLLLHHCLLMLEQYLWNNNNSLSVSFIGGSCKLCKNGCAEKRCMNKGLSRIPMEALGINVIKTLQNININIQFPITEELVRCGLILW